MAYQVLQNPLHFNGHMEQMRAALEATRKA